MQVKNIAELEHSAILSTFIKLPFVIVYHLSGPFTQVYCTRQNVLFVLMLYIPVNKFSVKSFWVEPVLSKGI